MRPTALIGVVAIWALASAALAGVSPVEPADGDLVFGETPVIGAGGLEASGEVVYTAEGDPVALFHYFSLDADCRARAVGIRLTEPPAHGSVSFSQGRQPPVRGGEPIYPGADPRARCADRLAPTRDATYLPAAGFSGVDRLVVQFSDRGRVFTDAIEINVERLKPPARRRRRWP
ncbi:MAG TPA: hypothetical protein VMU93_06420 [Caulobacteraceae bacterium]|nr:hypothetical protein [Caulobacteraceae bacterium]